MTRTKNGKVILIDHPVGKRIDRASPMVEALGYELEWVCPGRGESLPEPGPEHVAAIVYGGAENLSECDGVTHIRDELAWIEKWLKTERPFLGICLGGQMLAQTLGAKVAPDPEGYYEVGFFEIQPTEAANGFMSRPMHIYQWHREGFEVPSGAQALARGTGRFPNQAFRYGDNAYGIQFHPEVDASIFSGWLSEVHDIEQRPGAHPRAQQLADAERHDEPVGEWLDGFLRRWLGHD